ncbi:hypothetical protein JTE90_005134 [Oedothorax gibbosus]|uniref:Uncharacterized protein n=1 Tax=Oedothorax gibbosus TaxID=931172 RepID=A0AAV6ULU6_9ARAC|nr:hypothetical protein JTE90_005134 [Oedothorax gibbosus]
MMASAVKRLESVDNPHRDRLREVPLEDYWHEFSSFDDQPPGDEDEDDCSKTPDEGEAEEEWLREAGFENLIDSELTEQDEADLIEDALATLTARQISAVKRRLDTLRASKKRRVPRHHTRARADVRQLFSSSNSPPESLSTLHSEPLSLVCQTPDDPPPNRWSPRRSPKIEEPPPASGGHLRLNTRALPPIPFLGHTGGFSLKEWGRGIECESPTSVEVLRYESRRSVVRDRDYGSLSSLSSVSTEPLSSLETGFQEISSRIASANDIQLQSSKEILTS